jgi:aryl-alcohol dehydrogenase-like predicted oxidoreductase
MQYQYLGKTNIRVSEICLGTMMFGGKTSPDEAERIMLKALDSGINFFDTANVYEDGRSEEIVGQTLTSRRDQVVLATKFGFPAADPPNQQGLSRTNIIRALEDSLRRLKTDYIDLYYVHWPRYEMHLESLLRTLDDFVRQGRVRAIGVSNFPAWLLCRSLWLSEVKNLTSLVVLQVPYNLIERGIEVEVLPLCEAENMAVVPYRPLAIGVLTGKYLKSVDSDTRGATDDRVPTWNKRYRDAIAKLASSANRKWNTSATQVAIAWVRDHPAVTSAIVGISREEQLDELLTMEDWHLSAQEREEIGSWFPTAVWEESGGEYPHWRKAYRILR